MGDPIQAARRRAADLALDAAIGAVSDRLERYIAATNRRLDALERENPPGTGSLQDRTVPGGRSSTEAPRSEDSSHDPAPASSLALTDRFVRAARAAYCRSTMRRGRIWIAPRWFHGGVPVGVPGDLVFVIAPDPGDHSRNYLTVDRRVSSPRVWTHKVTNPAVASEDLPPRPDEPVDITLLLYPAIPS